MQEELTEISTNEELKVRFKNGISNTGYKKHTSYLSRIMEYSEEFFYFSSIATPSGKVVQHGYQSPNEKKKHASLAEEI
nr:unnamed protein product [Callosobruchus analis]